MRDDFRYLIFASLFLFAPVDICCQKILNPEYYPRDIRWDNFLVKGGEASQESQSILIDSKGFLWTGTENGLYRYDGARYLEYNVSNKDDQGFAGYSVTSIFEDSEGTIWVGTAEALNRLDQKTSTFIHYFPDSARRSGISNFIRTIKEDSDGLLWILTREDIYSFDRKNKTFNRYRVDSLSWVPENVYFPGDQHFAEDRSGNKWFVTYNGFYYYDHTGKDFSMVIPDNNINDLKTENVSMCISGDRKGNIWLGSSNKGLFKWNDELKNPEKVDLQPVGQNRNLFDGVSAILADKDGTIWIFGNRVFSNYNPENRQIKNYIIQYTRRTIYEPAGSDTWINQVFQQDDGTIWFLYNYAGLLFRFDPVTERLSLYRLPKYRVFQCIMDKDESLWFACRRDNIYRLLTDQIPYYTIEVKNVSHVATIHKGTFIEDDQNQIWFLFNLGINTCKKFDISESITLNRYRFPDGDSIASGGFKDSKGNLWFGNKNGKVSRFNPVTGRITNLTLATPPINPEVFWVPLIREDNNGGIWIAHANSLSFFNEERGRIDHIMELNNIKEDNEVNVVEDFLIDSYGTFWILTRKSLMSIRVPEMKITDYAGSIKGILDAPYTNANIRVEEDSYGNVFILNTRSGVYRFDRQKDAFINIQISREETGYAYYDLLIDRKDRLWISHSTGITLFDPLKNYSHLFKTPRLQIDIQSFQPATGQLLFLNENRLYVFKEAVAVNDIVPPVYVTRILVNGKDYNEVFDKGIDATAVKVLELAYRFNTFTIEFAALNYINPEQNRYRYFMTKYDKDTLMVSQGSSAEYKRVPPGRYKFWVTGSNNDGIWNPSGATLDIRILPPWYRSTVAYLFYFLAVLLMIGAYIRIRTRNLQREKQELESQVKARTAELELANKKLEEVDRIKTHFFTDISHEIRTPLSLILGPLEHISKDEMLDRSMSNMVEIMKRNARRLMHLVNQLLDISRLDAGRMKITIAEDDIIKCLRILLYEFLSLAESKSIKYTVDLPEGTFKTWFDRDKVEKIISNLLSNAFKYTPVKGTVQCFVRIEAGKNNIPGSFLQIRVTDTGRGIKKEHQNRIFDRFYRVEGKHERDGYGTGIGLSLVREFVSLLHGEINVNSIPGEGSDFSVILPLGKDHLSDEEYTITRPSPIMADLETVILPEHKYVSDSVKETEKGKMRILIIEDNADLRNFIKESLSDDYSILEADNGRSGLNTAYTMMPDIIITDILMPDLDGINLCRQLKNDEHTSHIPIIMLTARATIDDKLEGLKTGADDYIIKPFNMAELKMRISNMLALRKKLRLKYSGSNLLGLTPENLKSVDDRFINKIVTIISQNMKDFNFDVELLRENIGMSRVHLSRKLKILTGLTPGTLIRNIRLEKAAMLLLRHSGNITEIANSVGISNPSNFTKSFRNYFGVSPKEYSRNPWS